MYISWVLITVSAVTVTASLRYRSELSLDRRRLMLSGTTLDLLPVENEPGGTHSNSEQHIFLDPGKWGGQGQNHRP